MLDKRRKRRDNGVLDSSTELGSLTGSMTFGEMSIVGSDAIRIIPKGRATFIPEPNTFLLLLVGSLRVFALRRRF